MSTTQVTSPASRFARFNPFKTSAKPSAPPTPEPAYIPYNGPVERPPPTLRTPALPDAQQRDSWGDLKIDVSRANTHSPGAVPTPPDWTGADTEWQSRYGADVINIASEALAQTRANQAALASDPPAGNYPPSAGHYTTMMDTPAPSPSPRASTPADSPQHLSPRPNKTAKSPKSPRSITNLIAAAFSGSSSSRGGSTSKRGLASAPTSPRHLRPEPSYFSNPALEPIPDVLRAPPRKLQHSASAEWSTSPRARVDSYGAIPRTRVDSYQPVSRVRPSIPSQYEYGHGPSFDTTPSQRTHEQATSQHDGATSQHETAPSHYGYDQAPSFREFAPEPSIVEREPRPSTQVFGQDVYVRESWAGLPPEPRAVAPRPPGDSRGVAATRAQGMSSAQGKPSAPWISSTFTAPPPSQIAASHSAPPVPSSYSPSTSPHPYAYGSTRELEADEDTFDGQHTTPRFHLPRHGLKASISVPNLRIAPPPSSSSPQPEKARWEPPKGRDRWLSAETWCDALLLPRPRLRLRSLTGKMSASLTSGSAGKGSWTKGSTSRGSMAGKGSMGGSIGKATPKSSFAAGTEGEQYAYAPTLHSNAPPSSWAPPSGHAYAAAPPTPS
ncbi:hypothetical protein HDZ31DRAFT_70042, partial [Schizophyllum fasciatum]